LRRAKSPSVDGVWKAAAISLKTARS
jgi:hypothetical protein